MSGHNYIPKRGMEVTVKALPSLIGVLRSYRLAVRERRQVRCIERVGAN